MQWMVVRKALPVPVILAPNVTEGKSGKSRTAVHVLALLDMVRYQKVIVGLDVEPQHIIAESCFCATEDNLWELTFAVHTARRQQHLIPIPTCSRCLRVCASMTGMPVNRIVRGNP